MYRILTTIKIICELNTINYIFVISEFAISKKKSFQSKLLKKNRTMGRPLQFNDTKIYIHIYSLVTKRKPRHKSCISLGFSTE